MNNTPIKKNQQFESVDDFLESYYRGLEDELANAQFNKVYPGTQLNRANFNGMVTNDKNLDVLNIGQDLADFKYNPPNMDITKENPNALKEIMMQSGGYSIPVEYFNERGMPQSSAFDKYNQKLDKSLEIEKERERIGNILRQLSEK